MNRRTFLAAVAALPFVGRIAKAKSIPAQAIDIDYSAVESEYWPCCLFKSPPSARYPHGDYCLNLAVRMPDGKFGYCKLHATPDMSISGPVGQHVRIYGSDARLYSSTGPWFLTK